MNGLKAIDEILKEITSIEAGENITPLDKEYLDALYFSYDVLSRTCKARKQVLNNIDPEEQNGKIPQYGIDENNLADAVILSLKNKS